MRLNPRDESPNVKRLQLRLGLPVVGIYGPKTESGVKDFQSQKGLPVTGIVDEKTWNLLFPNDKIDLDKLIGEIPDEVIEELPLVIHKYSINTILRLSHFLGQCSHESGYFKRTVENLNYSAEGLLKTFSKYFNNSNVRKYARNPEKIASYVYGDRMGNGPEKTGDGYKFRGRGYLQCTGKETYRKLSDDIGEDFINYPELVATKYPLVSAAWFFNRRNLIVKSDKGSNNAVISEITLVINGGVNGLSERIKEFNKFFKILNS
jgi:putative chitinase